MSDPVSSNLVSRLREALRSRTWVNLPEDIAEAAAEIERAQRIMRRAISWLQIKEAAFATTKGPAIIQEMQSFVSGLTAEVSEQSTTNAGSIPARRLSDETPDDDGLLCENTGCDQGPLKAAVCLGCWNKLAAEVIELRKLRDSSVKAGAQCSARCSFLGKTMQCSLSVGHSGKHRAEHGDGGTTLWVDPVASDPLRDLACCGTFVRESASEFCATCGYTNLDHLRKRSAQNGRTDGG